MSKGKAEEILGLPQRYTKADLRHRYAALTREFHPDVAERNGHSAQEAQVRMADINRAYEYLRDLFAGDPSATLTRSPIGSTVEPGFADVDRRADARPAGKHMRREPEPSYADDPGRGRQAGYVNYNDYFDYADYFGRVDYASMSDEEFWDFVRNEEPASAPQEVPVNAQTVLLGGYVLRAVFVLLFALVWWRTSPVLPMNQAAYQFGGSALQSAARLVAGLVYPTYLVAYEVLTGNISALVREAINDAISWATGTYYDLRPKTSSSFCALHKLVSDQLWAVLMAPAVLLVAAKVAGMGAWGPAKVGLCAVAVLLGVDTLAACVRGGLVNLWTSALGERVETAYLNAHARLMRRCGTWNGR